MEEVHSKMTVTKVKELYGWNGHQYTRFRDAVFEEGSELLYGDKYWDLERKPERFNVARLSNNIMMRFIENLRAQLSNDDVESKRGISPELVKWKLQQWINAEKTR
ncbi:hypothetical protein SLS58_006558 [Diplodia intermedia]|uniref:Uncharacterized protein n=1 Tax=Diplodia intermedia TaxID=856260 RepID=A0ABR3TNQ4_9PEZI